MLGYHTISDIRKMGGIYADFDYESIGLMDNLLKDKTCCFASETQTHCFIFRKRIMFYNALMLSIPNHLFMKKIIYSIFNSKVTEKEKGNMSDLEWKNYCVMETTGPSKLVDLYNNFSNKEKEEIYLIPAKYASPFDGFQEELFKTGNLDKDLEDALKGAYAVHYFFSYRKEQACNPLEFKQLYL